MNRLLPACCLLALAASVVAQEPPKLYEVRQSYAMPVVELLSLSIVAWGADVKVETGLAGMVEAVFHIPDTLHPPVLQRNDYGDSTDQGSFQLARPDDGPPAAKDELWEIRIPRDLRHFDVIRAGFADVALWDIDRMGGIIYADSANIIMDLSSLESGHLTLTAEAERGDILLYVPKTATAHVVAECTLGMLSSPGFSELDLDQFERPGSDLEFSESWQGRKYIPAAPGGATLIAFPIAIRGDVKLVLVDQ